MDALSGKHNRAAAVHGPCSRQITSRCSLIRRTHLACLSDAANTLLLHMRCEVDSFTGKLVAVPPLNAEHGTPLEPSTGALKGTCAAQEATQRTNASIYQVRGHVRSMLHTLRAEQGSIVCGKWSWP